MSPNQPKISAPGPRLASLTSSTSRKVLEAKKPKPRVTPLESYLAKPIDQLQTLTVPKDVNLKTACDFARRKTAVGCRLQDMKGYARKGDPLNYKINSFLKALQLLILKTEGWPSARG